jgi:hypothetical protein
LIGEHAEMGLPSFIVCIKTSRQIQNSQTNTNRELAASAAGSLSGICRQAAFVLRESLKNEGCRGQPLPDAIGSSGEGGRGHAPGGLFQLLYWLGMRDALEKTHSGKNASHCFS